MESPATSGPVRSDGLPAQRRRERKRKDGQAGRCLPHAMMVGAPGGFAGRPVDAAPPRPGVQHRAAEPVVGQAAGLAARPEVRFEPAPAAINADAGRYAERAVGLRLLGLRPDAPASPLGARNGLQPVNHQCIRARTASIFLVAEPLAVWLAALDEDGLAAEAAAWLNGRYVLRGSPAWVCHNPQTTRRESSPRCWNLRKSCGWRDAWTSAPRGSTEVG